MQSAITLTFPPVLWDLTLQLSESVVQNVTPLPIGAKHLSSDSRSLAEYITTRVSWSDLPVPGVGTARESGVGVFKAAAEGFALRLPEVCLTWGPPVAGFLCAPGPITDPPYSP